MEVAKKDGKEGTRVLSSDFDPPQPPEPSALETAVTVGGVVALGAAAVALGVDGLLMAGNFPGWDEQEPIDVQALEKAVPGLDTTSAPDFSENARALCSNCQAAVPYESMALNEHGYFCVRCATDHSALR